MLHIFQGLKEQETIINIAYFWGGFLNLKYYNFNSDTKFVISITLALHKRTSAKTSNLYDNSFLLSRLNWTQISVDI